MHVNLVCFSLAKARSLEKEIMSSSINNAIALPDTLDCVREASRPLLGKPPWVITWATSLAVALVTGSPYSTLAERPGARSVQYRLAPPFDLGNVIIPKSEIYAGGPPKDGIPALTNPLVIAARDAAYLKPTDEVVGVEIADEARAYPLKILNYHEIVNDWLGGVPIAVTYCPLCHSVVVFDRRSEERVLEFGVSGLLYNSNVLMYDRGGRPESLWSQIATQGVSGPGARKPLKTLPVELTTWGEWQMRHPNTTVLSSQTGYARDYEVSPYQRYFASPGLMFPARPTSNRLAAKAVVLGVWVDSNARAYPLAAFPPQGGELGQDLAGKRFRLIYDKRYKSVRVVAADEGVQGMYSFWLAWSAFRPYTDVWDGKH